MKFIDQATIGESNQIYTDAPDLNWWSVLLVILAIILAVIAGQRPEPAGDCGALSVTPVLNSDWSNNANQP